MFEAWKENRRKATEAIWLAEIRARDADVGVPSTETMKERVAKAAAKRMWDVVDDCLQKGADVKGDYSISKKWGNDAYCAPFAKMGGLGLFSHREVPLLCIAVLHNDVTAAQNLLAQGANPTSGYSGWTGYNFTSLGIAVKYNNPDMVKLLCDSGASLKDDAPLRMAEGKGYNDIIKIIRAEEAKRAGGAVTSQPVPATAEEKILSDLEKLSPAAREKLLAAANEKFARPKADDAALSQDVTVSKPINLKKPTA